MTTTAEQKKSILCLMGPTASGKTDLAIKITEKFPCEIISVDSAMIYRDMNIGTAKPESNVLKKYPHHLINLVNPNETYSVAQFLSDVSITIEKILSHSATPLLVGGTMMYFNALEKGLSELPSANKTVREEILQRAERDGWLKLHKQLANIDPESAQRIHPNDPQRLLRALEVYEITGKPMSYFYTKETSPLANYNVINIAITPNDREILHRRIEARFKQMVQSGLIDEVKQFYLREDMHAELPSMRSVGYRQVWQYLAGELTYDEMIERGIIATRQLAKRQLTWLRRWESIHWFDSESPSLVPDVYSLIAQQL